MMKKGFGFSASRMAMAIGAALLAAGTGAAPVPRRHLALGYGPLHTRSKGWKRINRLNRSQHHRQANSYEHARKLAPLPHCLRPVR